MSLPNDGMTLKAALNMTHEEAAAMVLALVPERARPVAQAGLNGILQAYAQAYADAYAQAYAQAGFDAAVRYYTGTGELVLRDGPKVRGEIKTVIRDAEGRISTVISEPAIFVRHPPASESEHAAEILQGRDAVGTS